MQSSHFGYVSMFSVCEGQSVCCLTLLWMDIYKDYFKNSDVASGKHSWKE